MRLLPDDKRDWLVLPLLLWVPVAFLMMAGLQAAKSGEEVSSVPRVLGFITAAVAVPFVAANNPSFGVWSIHPRELYLNSVGR